MVSVLYLVRTLQKRQIDEHLSRTAVVSTVCWKRKNELRVSERCSETDDFLTVLSVSLIQVYEFSTLYARNRADFIKEKFNVLVFAIYLVPFIRYQVSGMRYEV